MNNKQMGFLAALYAITSCYDGDGNGLCGESTTEVLSILEEDYPALFRAYLMLGGV